jgi:Ca-activated chloride channel homolog
MAFMPFSRNRSHTQLVASPLLVGRLCLRGAVALLVSAPLFPQPLAPVRPARKSESSPLKVIRADVRMVLVSAIVADRKGVSVNGLTQDKFTILEDTAPQPILTFSREEAPCSVGVILDLSGSMRDKLPAATAAVRAFLKTANPEDESFLMAVASRPESLLSFTDDAGTLRNSLRAARAEGSTALIDTVYLGLSRMRSARNPRRALLIVSDGMDNNSRYSKAELLRTVQERDVQIYTIGIAERPAGKKAIQLTEESRGLALLGELAGLSGGMSFTVVNPDGILPAASKISRAIREQYVVGYRQSDRDDPGKWHAIQLRINSPQLKVYARKGYYSR